MMGSDGNNKSYPKWPSTRFSLALLGWIGFALVYAMRVNLSIAIVKMVEEPPLKHNRANEAKNKLLSELSEGLLVTPILRETN